MYDHPDQNRKIYQKLILFFVLFMLDRECVECFANETTNELFVC